MGKGEEEESLFKEWRHQQTNAVPSLMISIPPGINRTRRRASNVQTKECNVQQARTVPAECSVVIFIGLRRVKQRTIDTTYQ